MVGEVFGVECWRSLGAGVPFLIGDEGCEDRKGLVNSFGVIGFAGGRDSAVLSLTKVGGVIVRSSASGCVDGDECKCC